MNVFYCNYRALEEGARAADESIPFPLNESLHSYAWVKSHMWLGHVTQAGINESYHVCRLDRVTGAADGKKPIHESFQKYQWVKLNINWCCFDYFWRNCLVALLEALRAQLWMSHVIYTGLWQRILGWQMEAFSLQSLFHAGHFQFSINDIETGAEIQRFVLLSPPSRKESFAQVPYRFGFICVTWLIRMSEMTHY